jgi:hypothetical protein
MSQCLRHSSLPLPLLGHPIMAAHAPHSCYALPCVKSLLSHHPVFIFFFLLGRGKQYWVLNPGPHTLPVELCPQPFFFVFCFWKWEKKKKKKSHWLSRLVLTSKPSFQVTGIEGVHHHTQLVVNFFIAPDGSSEPLVMGICKENLQWRILQDCLEKNT